MSLRELKFKEVICIEDGCRLGYIGDLELDTETGRVTAFIIPGKRRFFGLFGREPDRVITWGEIRRFGEDILLVDCAETPALSP